MHQLGAFIKKSTVQIFCCRSANTEQLWNSFASVPVSLPSSGLPKPVIRWLRNGQELTGNEPGVSILEDGTLLILASVSPMDNGEYVCTAANDAGSTERKYQLKVNGDWPVL